jgi:predicted amidohydrolase
VRLILTELPLTLESAANFDAARNAVLESGVEPGPGDLLVLPELIGFRSTRAHYQAQVIDLARGLGCHVVGGSHTGDREGESRGGRVNGGLAVSPTGVVLGSYEKRHPYGGASDAQPGSPRPPFTIAGRTVRVLVCADFWYADLWLEAPGVDLVLVPALSVSRKRSPDYARQLWRHMAVSRAYEFCAFVGISDFASGWPGPDHGASGVAGLADPTGIDPAAFFRTVGPAGVMVHPLDFGALDALRIDRGKRGFLDRSALC